MMTEFHHIKVPGVCPDRLTKLGPAGWSSFHHIKVPGVCPDSGVRSIGDRTQSSIT
ncbi:Uncharacterized protein dnm_041880 [Desulfonema magnum]|uniref:Uncharacterized protein n=1 Tax=Desulfonema magnum TaxID=45655 RepID=A0A975BMD2_9BACT|nr:Uncharacterized protein dnm_041880 [Desulfonema magnum]